MNALNLNEQIDQFDSSNNQKTMNRWAMYVWQVMDMLQAFNTS